jgi:hypothetical protein
MEPVMHPDRMPSLSVSVIVPAGAAYDRPHTWRTDAGAVRASVQFRVGGYSYVAIQGPPAGLRELAAALTLAADQAEDESAEAEPVVGVAS